MTSTDWAAALTAMEDELNEHEAAVRTGELRSVPDFVPPAALGPLPAEHAARAEHLTQRIALLSTFVQYQLVATEGDLKHLERGQHRGGSPVALYLDASV